MTERPILFNGAMVRAILDGRKTHTRRIADTGLYAVDEAIHGTEIARRERANLIAQCPKGQPGDRLWVRETWQTLQELDHLAPRAVPTDSDIQYPATWDHWVSKHRPSIHMPRWASRITLEVTNVRVERLQDISEEGAKAEGAESGEFLEWLERAHSVGAEIPGAIFPTVRDEFRRIWDGIYRDAQSWDANPWVWDVEFRVTEVKR